MIRICSVPGCTAAACATCTAILRTERLKQPKRDRSITKCSSNRTWFISGSKRPEN